MQHDFLKVNDQYEYTLWDDKQNIILRTDDKKMLSLFLKDLVKKEVEIVDYILIHKGQIKPKTLFIMGNV